MMAPTQPQASPTATHRGTATSMALGFGLLLLAATPVLAQYCHDSRIRGTNIGLTPGAAGVNVPNVCNLLPCHEPQQDGLPRTEVTPPGCDGDERSCGVRITVPLVFPGNHQMDTNGHARIFWFGQGTPPPATCLPPPLGNCDPISFCGGLGSEFPVDHVETWIQVGASCRDIARRAADSSGAFRSYSVSGYACLGFLQDCTERVDVTELELDPETLWSLLDCDDPPPPCNSCPCNVGGGGGGCGGNVGGGAPFCLLPGSGPGALLGYRAGGAGHPGFPGSEEWNGSLGRYWSHDYAQRIVPDPDESHVWLITPDASFVEFGDLAGGAYGSVSPSDEYRTLLRTAGGWELHDLSGGVETFDGAGRWVSAADANGNGTTATYGAGGELAGVSFADGRSETFGYHPDGKLASITEVGVGGAASRTWSYTWSGEDLVRVDRPDGTAWAFRYDDSRLPGYRTRTTLIGTDGGERIESAWEYDSRGNVMRTWQGDESFSGLAAVETWSFHYDNPYRPEVTEVTDPLGKVTTYEVGRDPGGTRPRVTRISGDCGSCGLSPDSQLSYDDPANPLRPTREIDARGTVTLFDYDGNGRLLSRTEAFGTPLARTTTWEYAGPFPGLVTAIEQPSTSGAGVRRTEMSYDPRGNLTSQTVEGVESGSAFRLTTTTTYNAEGQPTAIDPPGFGSQDQTTFTYDTSRGNQFPLARIEPLIGATTFDYDSFNRRVRVTDVNGGLSLFPLKVDGDHRHSMPLSERFCQSPFH